MNPDTGELRRLSRDRTQLDEVFEPVPDIWAKLAQAKLREADALGRSSAMVNMRSNHPLARWGRDVKKAKRKAKIAAASRRRNRK